MNVIRIYAGTIAAIAALIVSLTAAPLRDVPQRLVQPDGTILECFASGDEYHNWLHDQNGYTIIRDPVTGYWVYAEVRGGELSPTSHVAGTIEPAAAGLSPGANVAPEYILQKRTEYTRMMRLEEERTHPDAGPAAELQSPPPSVIHNLIVFIRFSDEQEFGQSISFFDSLYNKQGEDVLSLYEYYLEASYGHLEIFSTFYPEPSGPTIVSYQDIHPRAYYKPFHETENPLGYDEDVHVFDYEIEDGRTFREHSLLTRAVEYVESQIPPALVIDGIGDGRVDCVSFIVRGGPEGWNSLLWPHRWALWSQETTIHGKRIWDYTFQLAVSGDSNGIPLPMRLGTVAHEMFHILGAPDLYRYDNSGIPVGHWDLMAFSFDPPQHMGAYMKYFYGGWITEIPTITEPGTYHLHPLASPGQNSYRILSAASADEFYIVEYRRKNTVFESVLPGEGLIVYRINTQAEGTGNMQSPDEVYVYRPGGTVDSVGVIQHAFYSVEAGRTEISDFTSPSAFLSDNSPGGLYIHDIGTAGETISFTVGSVPTTVADTELPTRVALHQNYPNPFNPSTTIRYSISDASYVVLKVYTMLGQEVATLVNAEQQANTYEVMLDGSNLASGMYMYRLYVGGEGVNGADAVKSKRLLLLR